MRKWEHMVITGIFTGTNTGQGSFWTSAYPRCYYMGPSGLELVTDFQYYKKERISEADAVAGCIAQLGDEGWELVAVSAPEKTAVGQATSYQSLYFKREKA